MTNQHVTPHPDGGWQVKAEGASRATIRTETKANAYDIGRQIAINQNSELFVHNAKGQFQDRNSYGNDPRSSKG